MAPTMARRPTSLRARDYCTHCYQDGAFADPDLTIDQMSAIVADFIEADDVTTAEAKAISRTILSDLKRWK